MVIVFAILMFGFLITIHEFGHYLFARLFKVSIKEFSIGMGPKIFTKVSKKTGISYSLRWLPIGGYVSMVGEDEESDDENALNKKSPWKRLVILAAGGLFNLIVGVLLCAVFVLMTMNRLGSTVIADFTENATSSYYLQEGDQIVEVNGKNVGIANELNFRVMWEAKTPETVTVTDSDGNEVTLENVGLLDLTVIRDGEKILLRDVPFAMTTEDGIGIGNPDFYVYRERATFSTVIRHIFCEARNDVNQVWSSLVGLLTGRVGIQNMSGPVGITEQMGQAASLDFAYLIFFAALIAINLGLFNLLPIPALDGGRIVFVLIEAIRGKPVNRELEGKIHTGAMLCLFALMIFVLIKDTVGLFV